MEGIGDGVDIAVMGDHDARQLDAQNAELRQVQDAARLGGAVIAGSEGQIAFELAGRLLRHDIDRAAQRITAIERALGATQDFDMVDIRHVGHVADRLGDEDAVDIEADGRVPIRGRVDGDAAADGEVGFGLIAGGLDQRDVRREALDAANVGDAAFLKIGRVERRHRDRHVAQLLLTALGRNDDFLKAALGRGVLRGLGGALGEGRKGKTGGERRSGQESDSQAMMRRQRHTAHFLPLK